MNKTDVGYPITISWTTTDTVSLPSEVNPYGLFAVRSVLESPSGEIDHSVIHPTGPETLQNTIVYLPEEPLAENTPHILRATIEHKGGRKEIEFNFTTGETVDWNQYMIDLIGDVGDTDDSDSDSDTQPEDTDDSDVPEDTDDTDTDARRSAAVTNVSKRFVPMSDLIRHRVRGAPTP